MNQPQSDYQQALSDGWLPIREVARRTGVNPVTLRAWERRYGLVMPQRTSKGHRLYSEAQISRIQNILTWLQRGVAVSKVQELLDKHTAPATKALPLSPWRELQQQCMNAISSTQSHQLDELFNAALALYPAATLCEHLMLPLLAQLEERWQGQFGAQLERVLLHTWLRSKLGARLYHHNRQQEGAPLLLINQSAQAALPELWLTAWLASGCPLAIFDGPLPSGELALAVERLKPRAVLLYSNQALDLSQLTRLLNGVHCPRLLAGAAVQIHRQQLSKLDLHLAEHPLAAVQQLRALGLLGFPAGELGSTTT